MYIPKARLMSSGRWFVNLRVGGKSTNATFDTEEEARAWAASMKATLKNNQRNYTDYEKLIKGLGKDVGNIQKDIKHLPSVSMELASVDKMEGIDFENYCANLFLMSRHFNGGKIHTTRGTADYGADLLIDCLDGTRVAVQCKRMSGNVGIRAVQEVVASKNHYHAVAAAIITNSHFTTAAKELAYSNGVVLLDRKYLVKLIDYKLETINNILNKNQWEELILDLGYLAKNP